MDALSFFDVSPPTPASVVATSMVDVAGKELEITLGVILADLKDPKSC